MPRSSSCKRKHVRSNAEYGITMDGQLVATYCRHCDGFLKGTNTLYSPEHTGIPRCCCGTNNPSNNHAGSSLAQTNCNLPAKNSTEMAVPSPVATTNDATTGSHVDGRTNIPVNSTIAMPSPVPNKDAPTGSPLAETNPPAAKSSEMVSNKDPSTGSTERALTSPVVFPKAAATASAHSVTNLSAISAELTLSPVETNDIPNGSSLDKTNSLVKNTEIVMPYPFAPKAATSPLAGTNNLPVNRAETPPPPPMVSPFASNLKAPRYYQLPPLSPVAAPTEVQTIGEHDVLFGRGNTKNKGNIRFREIVASKKLISLGDKKLEKKAIAQECVDAVRQNGGRFLKRDDAGIWVEVDNAQSTEKALHVLYEEHYVRHKRLQKEQSGFIMPEPQQQKRQKVVNGNVSTASPVLPQPNDPTHKGTRSPLAGTPAHSTEAMPSPNAAAPSSVVPAPIEVPKLTDPSCKNSGSPVAEANPTAKRANSTEIVGNKDASTGGSALDRTNHLVENTGKVVPSTGGIVTKAISTGSPLAGTNLPVNGTEIVPPSVKANSKAAALSSAVPAPVAFPQPKLGKIPKLLLEDIHKENANDVAWALMALNDIIQEASSGNLKYRRKLATGGATGMVILVMRKWQKHLGIQLLGCRCLGNLAINDRKLAVVTLGGVEALISAMKLFPDSNELQLKASGSLRNVFVLPDQKLKARGTKTMRDIKNRFVYEMDGLHVVLKAMEAFPDCITTQVDCITVLYCVLASSQSNCQEAMLKDGVVPVVCAAIVKHFEAPQVERIASLFLDKMITERGSI